MSLGIKIYKIRDFIRKTETGEIDFDRSIKIVRELAAAAAFHSGAGQIPAPLNSCPMQCSCFYYFIGVQII